MFLFLSSEHAAVAQESRAAAVTCLTCPSFFFFLPPVALSVSRPPLFSSFLALPLSLFTSSSTAARATSFSRCLRSNMACAHVQNHVQLFTQPLLGRVQDSEGTTAKKEARRQTSEPRLFHPVKSVNAAFPLLFLVSFGNFSFLGSWFLMAESRGTPQVPVPICPGEPVRGEAPRWLCGGSFIEPEGQTLQQKCHQATLFLSCCFRFCSDL